MGFKWKIKAPVTATNAIYLENANGKEGRPFTARFLQTGLVKYDFGVCVLEKDDADKFINTFVGKPVIIDHKEYIMPEDVKGEIQKVWFNPDDAWYWCSGIITDDEAIKLIEEGYNVSCQYPITEHLRNTDGKLHNGNPYDIKILNGVGEHLAIVKKPRYEGAFIAANAYFKEVNDYKEILKCINELDKGGQMDEKLKELCAGVVNAFMKAKNEADAEKEKTDEEKRKEEEERKKEEEARNKAKNEEEEGKGKDTDKGDDTDKRKNIREVEAALFEKGLRKELVYWVIKLMEENSYTKSEAGTADNKAKNNCKNEEKEKEKEYEELKEKVFEEVKNQIAKNSMDNMKTAFYEDKSSKTDPLYISPKKGLELGKQIYG